jgi:hypothetical protein
MWTEGWVFYCHDCAQQMVTVGRVMGFNAPHNSLREMTPEEMVVNQSAEDIARELSTFLYKKNLLLVGVSDLIAGYRLNLTKFTDEEYAHLLELQGGLFKALRDEGGG